ncbi:hypothetical protein MKW98_015550 [Papaver atlanticum]|uniref:Uncharacterized protein n=1 Tax=Papaver atlanticum TaxID=357466 RepID=A0AAD4S6L2_9MAGN|nr:hypothetical protein MKW98_015550 [Papaver atlanticum]
MCIAVQWLSYTTPIILCHCSGKLSGDTFILFNQQLIGSKRGLENSLETQSLSFWEHSLRDAKLGFKDLEVILVGRSACIPAVQELVKSSTAKDPNVTVNHGEVVALGAAVLAGALSGDN